MQNKPSVTDLIDLLAKPALISWANKQGLLGINVQEKRRRSLAKGTSIHAQIASAVSGGPGFVEAADAANFAAFLGRGIRITSVEQNIETEWFVGRYDCTLTDADGVDYVADFKRGFKRRIYLEYKLQLIAYTMARPAMMAIVPVPKFELVPVEVPDRRPYEQILIQLAAIWHLKREIDNEQVSCL